MRKYINYFLGVMVILSFSACKEANNLGSMQFKFTGAKDTLVYLGSSTTLNLKIFFLGGESETVDLSILGQGNGTSITFSRTTIEPGESCSMIITSVATADTGYFPIILKGVTPSGGLVTREFMLHVAKPINKPPRIFLLGSPNFIVTLNSSYTEPGYTAGDEEDGDITTQVTVSGSINVDSVGLYYISYVVTDSEGLKDSVVRIINVRNSLNYLNGSHSVVTTDLSNGSTRTWLTTLSASVSVNNQIKIFKISNCFLANPILTYDPVKDSLFLPSQSFICITPNDTLQHTFEGKGKIIQGTIKRITLYYTNSYIDTLGNPILLNLRDDYQLF
ncbi:MAG: DUF5011 domain-containing protein [Bacteroidia bacterium]